MLCVYVLHSIKLDRFYIGFTSDFDTRLEFHRQAEQHKFTYNADDWTLFLIVECNSKTQGLSIEKHIKAMKSKVCINNLKRRSLGITNSILAKICNVYYQNVT